MNRPVTCGDTQHTLVALGRTCGFPLLGSCQSNRKRPVIGREPSGPFSPVRRIRRILAGHPELAPHRLCSRDGIREVVGHRLEVTAALTRERGHKRMSRQLHSVSGDFGPHLAFSLTTSLRSVEWNVSDGPAGGSKPLRFAPGFDRKQSLFSLLDPSPEPHQQRGNQQTAREAISLPARIYRLSYSLLAGDARSISGNTFHSGHREVVMRCLTGTEMTTISPLRSPTNWTEYGSGAHTSPLFPVGGPR